MLKCLDDVYQRHVMCSKFDQSAHTVEFLYIIGSISFVFGYIMLKYIALKSRKKMQKKIRKEIIISKARHSSSLLLHFFFFLNYDSQINIAMDALTRCDLPIWITFYIYLIQIIIRLVHYEHLYCIQTHTF